MSRGDFLENMGTGIVSAGNTFIGPGGVDTANAPIKSGSTTIIDATGLNPSAVDGQIVGPFCFETTIDATSATATLCPRTDHTTFAAHTMPKSGTIVAMALQAGGAALPSGESVTIAMKIGNTVSTTCLMTMASGVQVKSATFAKGATGCTFAANQQIVLTAVWSSMTTQTLEVGVYIEI